MCNKGKYKIYIAGLYQETNTFCPDTTDMRLFERGYYLKAHAIADRLNGTNTEIGGFYELFKDDPSVELIPGVAAWAVASGKIENQTLEEILDDIVTSLKANLPVDGVLWALHGALVSQDKDDCEGYIISKVKELLGQQIPVVCTLDYHANVTAEMVDAADCLVGYRTYPHTDFQQTGQKAAQVLYSLITGKTRYSKLFEVLPLILPVENTETQSGPLASIIQKLNQLDQDKDIISASFFCPHPWLDIYDYHLSLLVYYKSQSATKYKEFAAETMKQIWCNREEFFVHYPSIDDLLCTIDSYKKPIILVDSGDVTSAGGAGDSTEILRALISKNSNLNSILTIVDPLTVQRAIEIGEGNKEQFSVGGKAGFKYNSRIPLVAQVIKISDSPVKVKGASFSGLSLNMGRRVLLEIAPKISIIVSEYTSLIHDAEIVRSMGLKPEQADVIVQKSHKLFRASYKDIAKSIVILDTPGFTDMNLKRLPYKKVQRPIYPLDDFCECPQERILTHDN
ncbi:MAG: M81 family metallopeptidase [Planctomycetota bacterium]